MTDLATQLAALGDHVRLEQDVRLAAEYPLGSLRADFVAAEQRPKLGRALLLRRLLPMVAALGLLAAALGTRALRRPLDATADHHAISVGDWIRVPSAAVPLDFSDGTRITLEPGARARLEGIDSAGAQLAIETGHADVRVVPGRGGRWRLSLGPFTVEVTGTQFDVGWDPDSEQLSLSMREGKVLVSGCVLGDGRPLMAGEVLTASCRERRFEIARLKQPAPDATPAAHESPTEAPAPGPVGALAEPALARRSDSAPAIAPAVHQDTPAPPPESWQVLARAGKYKAALLAANSVGFDAELGHDSLEDLSLLGDVARFGGDTGAAIKAYGALRHRFPHTPRAANAAFAIGRIEFDQLGAFGESERWFASYLAEQPRGQLAREALGRRMEALNRAGNREAARVVAQSYQKSYPRGPHIRLAEQLLLGQGG